MSPAPGHFPGACAHDRTYGPNWACPECLDALGRTITPAFREALANDLYVRVVRPELTWWDDLTPETQEGWRRAADYAIALGAHPPVPKENT